MQRIVTIAANTVFATFYVGATECSGRFLESVHGHRMTDQQATRADPADRQDYSTGILKKTFVAPGERWYADNTREAILADHWPPSNYCIVP